jgi:hypothetical protein
LTFVESRGDELRANAASLPIGPDANEVDDANATFVAPGKEECEEANRLVYLERDQ